MSQLVIGLGFRDKATAQSISEVLAAVVARIATPGDAPALAVPEDKASHPGLLAAVQACRFTVEMVGPEAMRAAAARVKTRSERVTQLRGVGSVCEAAALAVAGANARLIVSRVVSTDRSATAAAAMTGDTMP